MAVMAGKVESGVRQRIAFLFTGEGQEHVGMARHLYATEPVFREAIASCQAALAQELENPLASVLYAREDRGEVLADPAYGHAALFAVEYALLQLWRSWGIEASAVLGHGVGEYVAATAAGVLGPEDGLRLVVARARVAPSLVPVGWRKASLTTRRGDVRQIATAFPASAVIVAVNSPRHAVIVAPELVLHDMRGRLAAEGIRVRLGAAGSAVAGDTAARARLQAEAARVTYRPPKVPMISATTGNWVSADTDWASHWAAHASQPVRFSAAIEVLHSRYHRFLEIGPAPVLTSWGSQCIPSPEARWLASLDGEDDWSSMLASLAALHVAGFPVRWSAVDSPYDRQKVSLPTYPFEREPYWIELPSPRQSPTLTPESAALADPAGRATIDRLLRAWGDDGSQAIVRMVTAPLVFFSSSGQSFFFVNEKGSSMLVAGYVGPPQSFERAVRELMAYARDRELNLLMIAQEGHARRMQKLGFATSPVGVWQSINAQSFSVHAPGMRRLRSKASSYANRGDIRTEEYRVGSDPIVDRRFVELMEQWVARKKPKATFVSLLRDLVLTGGLPSRHRVFLTRRQNAIDSVILLSPIEARNGYLLDLEFYPGDMPNGCLEFSIVNIIELLKREGRSYFSFGATYGTQLDPDPHEDLRIKELLQTFHRQGILNEDGNFEFKKKFQPETVRKYLCTLPDVDLSSLPDTLLMFAAPDAPPRARERTSAPPPADRRSEAATPRVQPAFDTPLARAPIRPLLGRRVPLASGIAVFQSTLVANDPELPWLADHRVLDTVVVPAAAYIAMGLAAAGAVFPGEQPMLELLSLAEALAVDDHRPRTVQLTFEREDGRGGKLSIWSSVGQSASGDVDWTLHVSGRVERPVKRDWRAPTVAKSLGQVRSRGMRPTNAAEYYDQMAQFGFRYGPSFHVIEELWSGYGEALARIRLPDRLVADTDSYCMHPVLLDGCLQVQGASLLASRTGLEQAAMYVPVGIERVDIARQPSTELWVYSKLRPAADAPFERIVGDITVWDAQGESVGRIEGLAVGRTSAEVLHQLFAAQERQAEALCRLDWRAASRRRDGRPAPAATNLGWMVFADAGGIGARLAELLRARGDRCVLVRTGDDFDISDPECWSLNPSEAEHFRRALENAPPFDRFVYAWSADSAPWQSLDAGSLGIAQLAGCCGLLHVAQALARAERADSSAQLWVVTRGVQPVADDLARVNPAQAPVWGLGRTIAQEHPRLWGGMIDLGPDPAPSDADRLLDEISDPEEEDHIAYAGGERYVARLVPTGGAASAFRLRFQADATYLIAGGAGGLGRTVARWMVERGARHLVLAGRAPMTEEVGALLSELRARRSPRRPVRAGGRRAGTRRGPRLGANWCDDAPAARHRPLRGRAR